MNQEASYWKRSGREKIQELKKRISNNLTHDFNYSSLIAIYNRDMNFDIKVNEEFRNVTKQVFRSGFGTERRKSNYLKSKKYNSQVHAQFVCNSLIQDEDQMPFMDGYLNDSDSDSDSASNIYNYQCYSSYQKDNTFLYSTKTVSQLGWEKAMENSSETDPPTDIESKINEELSQLLNTYFFK